MTSELPFVAVLVTVRLAMVELARSKFTVILPAEEMTTSSPEPGTPLGDQLPVTFQLPPLDPIHVLVVPKLCAVNKHDSSRNIDTFIPEEYFVTPSSKKRLQLFIIIPNHNGFNLEFPVDLEISVDCC
jgi:hypothetical protein